MPVPQTVATPIDWVKLSSPQLAQQRGTYSIPGSNIIELGDARMRRKGLAFPAPSTMLGAIKMASRQRSLPDKYYAEIPSVIKKSALLTLIFCIFSLLLYWTTGFMVLHPFAAVIISIAAIIFYLIGILRRRAAKNDTRDLA
jgi:hypothetical protein